MADYDLYYWSVPFRGQFVRAVLAFADKTWNEIDDAAISKLMQGPVSAMPVPFMGPPLLVDRMSDFAIAEMPAILLYLGETLDLLPTDATLRALTIKVVNDANDVIDEITLNGGRDMWTPERWTSFRPRIEKWMSIWEETGRRHGLELKRGFLLGGKSPGIADIVTATLWTTMTERFSKIDAVFQQVAPMTAALSRRISAAPSLVALAARARAEYGDAYAGGQIGESMKKVLGN
jgi:glutathione S-transferase